jgi:predicted PurR-regulated permease PerM
MKPVTIRPPRSVEVSFVGPLITIAIVIAALYYGKEVLIPFALALLLSFVLTPPVTWLEKLRLARIPSVLLVLVVAFAMAGGIVWLGVTQLADIINHLPQYKENIQRKVAAMRNPAGSVLSKAEDSINQLSSAVSTSSPPTDTRTGETQNSLSPTASSRKTRTKTPKPVGPVPVEVVQRGPGMMASLGLVGISLAHFLGVAAAVLIFTLFMLMQRGDLRNRFFQLVGTGHLNVMTAALDDAARGVSRYMLTQALINGTFGLLLGLGLYWIGVPNAPFWGVLGAILRFVPYIGTLIAGICPMLLALAVFDGWTKPLLTLGLFAGIELTMSAAIEPWLYGAHTGVSSLAILVSAAFWTLLWGPIGLVLSTPLTVCLLVLGRYAPPLKFLGVLLGDKVLLPPEACFYQRLLAMDEDEAREIAEGFLKDRSYGELYDLVVVPALALAEKDRHQNALDDVREEFIHRSTRDLIEDWADQTTTKEPDTLEASSVSVLCIPARDEADELVALMLGHVLRESHFNAEIAPIGSFDILDEHQPDIVFVSALPPYALSQARSLCRKIRRKRPNLKIIVGLWGSTAEIEKVQERLGPGCFDTVVTDLRQAELQVRALAPPIEAPCEQPLPVDESSSVFLGADERT